MDQILADEDDLGDVLWPLADNQGTVRDLVNSSGVVQNHLTFDAFGKIMTETNATVDHLYAYTGREWDADVELYYYRARWYDPAVGRFIAEDPIGFSGGDANLSRYLANNPANFTDPSGLAGILGQGEQVDFERTRRALAARNAALCEAGGLPNAAARRAANRVGEGMAIIAGVGAFVDLAAPALIEQALLAGPEGAITGKAGGFLWLRSKIVITKGGRVIGRFGAAQIRAGEQFLIKKGILSKGTHSVKEIAETLGGLNRVNITDNGLRHVLDRHTINGIAKFAKRSKFNPGVNVTNLVNSAAGRSGTIQRGRIVRVVDAGKHIGVDRTTGCQISTFTVVTEANGELVTAFPGTPSNF